MLIRIYYQYVMRLINQCDLVNFCIKIQEAAFLI